MFTLPRPGMILAGFFAQLAICRIITLASDNTCINDGITWFLLIAVSVGVGMITALKSPENRVLHGAIAFVGSLVLYLTGQSLGMMAIVCSNGKPSSYMYCSIVTMLIATVVIFLHFVGKETLNPDLEIRDPDSELFLLGLCFQYMVFGCISVIKKAPYNFCAKNGLGSWLELAVVSLILAFLNLKKNGASRSLFTFLCTFIIHLTIGGVGGLAILCVGPMDSIDVLVNYATATSKIYIYFGLTLHIIVALILTISYLNKYPTTREEAQKHHAQDAHLIPSYHEAGYPMQPTQSSYPPQQPYPTQEIYPTQTPHPTNESYPPQATQPPQASYPPQATHPMQASYPPQESYPSQAMHNPYKSQDF